MLCLIWYKCAFHCCNCIPLCVFVQYRTDPTGRVRNWWKFCPPHQELNSPSKTYILHVTLLVSCNLSPMFSFSCATDTLPLIAIHVLLSLSLFLSVWETNEISSAGWPQCLLWGMSRKYDHPDTTSVLWACLGSYTTLCYHNKLFYSMWKDIWEKQPAKLMWW